VGLIKVLRGHEFKFEPEEVSIWIWLWNLDTVFEGVRGMKQVARILSLAFCVLLISTVFSFTMTTTASAQPIEEWVAIYDGPAGGDDHAINMVMGSSGNVYVTGHGRWNFYEGDDYLTISYDSSGNELWVARYDGPKSGNDWARDIATDSSENIYITGSSVGNMYDYATIAYDSSGNELWVARYDGPASRMDLGTNLALDASDNVYVTGRSEDESEVYDIVTIAYDSSGNELWVARYDSPSSLHDIPEDISIDSFGNVIVTGSSSSDFGHYCLDCDWVTIAYDSSGNELWVTPYNGPGNAADKAQALATDSSGNIYVTGQSTGSGTLNDITTIAYDSSGNELWVARYDGPASIEDEAYDLALDTLGNVYVTGYSDDRGEYWYSNYTTIAYDPSGYELWVATYDGPGDGDDRSSDIAVGPLGNIYITGGSSRGYPDVYFATVAYDPSGYELWVMKYDGGSIRSIGRDIAVDPIGNVYVTGYGLFNQTGFDAITIKYASGQTPEPTLDLDPDTLNLKSKGRWITGYIELYDGRDVRDIDIGTLLLNETIPAERWPYAVGDYDEDGIPDLMVKFNRSRVQEYIEGLNLSPGGGGIFGYWVTLTVTGSFKDGTTFECSDTIRVLTAERMGFEPGPFLQRTCEGMMDEDTLADQQQSDVGRTSVPQLRLRRSPFPIPRVR
jgi:hypothetical protein